MTFSSASDGWYSSPASRNDDSTLNRRQCCCCKENVTSICYEVSKENEAHICSHCVQYYLASSKDELNKFICLRKIQLGKEK